MARVVVTTPYGDAEIALLEEAPRTTAHVLAMVRAGVYGASAFYRAQRRDHWVRGREFTVLQGGPGRADVPTVEHEPGAARHGRGSVSLARAEPGTAGAEFFVCFDDAAPALDPGAGPPMDGHGFAVFGHIVCGLQVLEQIHRSQTGDEAPHPLMRGQMLQQPVPFELRL